GDRRSVRWAGGCESRSVRRRASPRRRWPREDAILADSLGGHAELLTDPPGAGRAGHLRLPCGGRNHRRVPKRRGRLWWWQLTAGIGVPTVLALALLPHSDWTLVLVGGVLGVVQIAMSLPTSIGRRRTRTGGVGTAAVEARWL